MKIQIELSDSEIRDAIADKINAKMGWNTSPPHPNKIYGLKILVNGSVKFKNKRARKEVQRIIASAVTYS